MTLEEIEQLHFTRVPIAELFSEIERVYGSSQPDTDARARALYLMGVYYELHDREKAVAYYSEAQRIATKLNNKRLISDLLHYEANEALRSGDLAVVNRLEQQALALAIEVKHPHRICFAYYMLAIVALRYGAHEEGIDYLKHGLDVSERHGILKVQIRLLSKLAEVCLLSQNPVTGKKYANGAIRIATELSMNNEILEATIRLATIEFELKNYAEVTKLVTKVGKILPKENHQLWFGIHTLMGKVYESKRKYELSESEFRTALSLTDYVNSARVRANIHAHLAELYLVTKKPQQAVQESLAGLADAEKAQDVYHRKEAFRYVHESYKMLGDYKQAYDYLERYNAILSQNDMELLKSRLAYHELKSDYEQEKLKSETQTKKSELLRIKLDYKEQELTEKIRHLIKQAEAVRQFRNDLRALIRRTPTDDPSVNDIRARLASFTEEEINWNEFEKDFMELHPEFLQTLSEKFPDLTKMEQRIAAMIRMDLKSADIARLFSITERAVEFHRLNLRKKLKLKKTELLPQYLSNL
jgi:tetratricopeptide (TPR) repeat protein/DNA-binding CsgD family transcriptional regulator